MTDPSLTALTQSRSELVTKAAQVCDADVALLLLVDSLGSNMSLWLSYAWCKPEYRIELRLDQVAQLPFKVGTSLSEAILREKAETLVQSLEIPFLPVTSVRSVLLSGEVAPIETSYSFDQSDYVGLLVLAGAKCDTSAVEPIANVLASSISIGRYKRFIRSVLHSQQFLPAHSEDLDHAVSAASQLIGEELGAQQIGYRNLNQSTVWRTLSGPPAIDIDGGGKFVDDRGPTDVLIPLAQRNGSADTLSVRLFQKSYVLDECSFAPLDSFLRKLKVERTPIFEIVMSNKFVPGYLQRRFSQTDARIASVVYKDLQNIVDSKLSDENHTWVFDTLNEDAISFASEPKAILRALLKTFCGFDNVHVVDIEPHSDQLKTSIRSARPGSPLDASYVDKLERRYLQRFYYGSGEIDYSKVRIGISTNCGRNLIEVHTPREFSTSTIYLISVNGRRVPQAVLRSLVALFNELFIRARRDDFGMARSNNLTETRHAVVHHFAAAMHAISNIKTKWDRGTRNREYWLSLLDDPVMPESIDVADWSLNHAQLILENGRFLIKDIDPRSLNRKPLNILQVVRDSFSVLRLEYRRKGLRLIHRVRGNPPSILNGDEVLMRIAIMNLADNAIKYAPRSTALRWELAFGPDRYTFSISNVGDLLAPESLNLLTQVGFRGRQRDHLNLRPGTGLGLPVAHRIIKAHNDKSGLQLRSEEFNQELGGPTNTFYFELPYLTGLGSAQSS